MPRYLGSSCGVIASIAVAAACTAWASVACAREPFRFPEARHGAGQLRYVRRVPVLSVEGSPREIGEQVGMLALAPSRPLFDSVDDFVASLGWRAIYPVLLKTGGQLLAQMPEDHRKELETAAAAADVPLDLLAFANTVSDFLNIGGCATLVVEPERSSSGETIFGRNMDWPPFGALPEMTLVTVVRPRGKRAFATVGYPTMLGATSGMNDAGLALAMLEVSSAADRSPHFDARGTPTSFAFRRVLEECATVDEADRLLRGMKQTTMYNLAVCDAEHGAVFEATTRSFQRRNAADGLCLCTNHFRIQGLATSMVCYRHSRLARLGHDRDDWSIADVSRAMHAVNQGERTLQTMIFEPAALRLHLAAGYGPASAKPLQTVELADFLVSQRE